MRDVVISSKFIESSHESIRWDGPSNNHSNNTLGRAPAIWLKKKLPEREREQLGQVIGLVQTSVNEETRLASLEHLSPKFSYDIS